jgi:hypothetical protein
MASEIQEQIVREAPDIEARKVGLMDSAKALTDAANLNALSGEYLTPDYQVAGMSPDQLMALQLGREGIGAYQPYLGAASDALLSGSSLLGEGAGILRGADTRGKFGGAYAAMTKAGIPIDMMGQSANLVTQGIPLIGQGATGIQDAQAMGKLYQQANLADATGTLSDAARIAKGASPSDFAKAYSTLDQGLGSLSGAAQMYAPSRVQEFMNPYQQYVIDEATRQIGRQGQISQQEMQAQAARAGAFGGMGLGAQQAALNRALTQQKNSTIASALYQGYQAAAQQAQQAFEAQQARQMQQAQGYQSAATLASQIEQARQSQALQQAQTMAGIGGTQSQQALEQTRLGQNAAAQQAAMANQLAALSGLYGNLGTQQANIYAQQSQLGQSMAQGIGNLASQEFGIGRDMAMGLGSLGTQQGNIGAQQAALGQTAQALGQQDTNFLFNLGSAQQKQLQAELDAERQNTLQQNMQPYQQVAFLSDIYKGAPSSSMSSMQQLQAAPSPFQQAAGLGIAGLSAAAAGARAGII